MTREKTIVCMLTAAAMIGTCVGTARANFVFGNFEGTSDGFGAWTGSSIVPFAGATDGSTYSYSTVGATLGTYALDVNNGGGYKQDVAFDFKGNGDLAAFLANDVLSFDVTAPSAAAENTTSGYWQPYDVIINAQGWGFNTIAPSTPLANQYYYAGFNGNTFTVSVNYDAVKAAIGSNPGWLQMIIATNDGGGTSAGGSGSYQPQDFLFDNFQLSSVPEPTSVGVVGVGVLAAVSRRRRA